MSEIPNPSSPSSSQAPIRLSSLVLTLIIIVSLIVFWQLPPQIPLFFSLSRGRSQLADKWWFILLPSLATLFFITNYTLYRRLITISRPLIGLLNWLGFLIMFLFAAALFNIIFLAF